MTAIKPTQAECEIMLEQRAASECVQYDGKTGGKRHDHYSTCKDKLKAKCKVQKARS